MKILVIPDINGDIRRWNFVPDCLKNKAYDKVVFLGNYFGGPSNSHAQMAMFIDIVSLKKKYPDKVELLIGKQEIQYVPGGIMLPGYSRIMSGAIFKLLIENEDNLSIAYQKDNVVFSSAGITSGWIDEHMYRLKKDCGFNGKNYADAINTMYSRWPNIFNKRSAYRGGDSANGSPIWADIMEFSYDNIPKHLNQICGHSIVPKVKYKTDGDDLESGEVIFTNCLETTTHYVEAFVDEYNFYYDIYDHTDIDADAIRELQRGAVDRQVYYIPQPVPAVPATERDAFFIDDIGIGDPNAEERANQ